MKTPREILLARHQAVEPKLDEIRRGAVAGLTPRPTGEPGFPFVLRLWRELILPRPKAWAAVAAMWMVIFALKVSTPGTPQAVVQKSSASPEVLAEVRQQKLLFAELVGVAKPRVAEPIKSTPPQPRSDRRLRIPIG